jgi:hypothetical protein
VTPARRRDVSERLAGANCCLHLSRCLGAGGISARLRRRRRGGVADAGVPGSGFTYVDGEGWVNLTGDVYCGDGWARTTVARPPRTTVDYALKKYAEINML